MGIFDLSEWRSLWNLYKPPKNYTYGRSDSHMYSSSARLNYSNGDISSAKRRYLVKRYDDVDGQRTTVSRQPSRETGRRAGSLPPSNIRTLFESKKQNNGMVEKQKSPSQAPSKSPFARKVSSPPSPNISDSDPVKYSTINRSRHRTDDAPPPVPDSSWIRRTNDDSSPENSPLKQSKTRRPLPKEPSKSWDRQHSGKSIDDLTAREQRNKQESPELPDSREYPATVSEARQKFQQLAKAQQQRQPPSAKYNPPLRDQKFRSELDIMEPPKVMEQYKSAIDVYDYPRKDGQIQKRSSLYNLANNSGLPEGEQIKTYKAKPARAVLPIASKSTGNIALLGINSDTSDNEQFVTSTPRSSTRKTRSRESLLDDEWETEDVVLRRGGDELGFFILGGKEDEVRPGDSQIYISKIEHNGVAARNGRLRVGDIITAVNGTDMNQVSHQVATRLLRSSGQVVRIKIKRYVGKVHIKLIVMKKNGQPLGISITGGVQNEVTDGDTAIYIRKIIPNGVAERTGGLEVGDQIHKVNNVSLQNVTHHFAIETLKNAGDEVALVVAKTGRINPIIFNEPKA